MNKFGVIVLMVLVGVTGLLFADPEELATLRKGGIAQEAEPPRMMTVENKDIKRTRNYPMQPPTIPHKIENYLAWKMQASKEVWGTILGTINTREKFLDKRLELAQHEWSRLKANNSLECRNCHDLTYMDFTRQSRRAEQSHNTLLASGEITCIDCHKGIAHELPDMSGVERWE